MNGMFCPSCGSTKGPFFGGLCKNCFFHQKKIINLPDEIKVEHCGFCNKIRLRGKWTEQNEKSLKDFVKRKSKIKGLNDYSVKVSLEPMGEKTLAIAKATGLVEGNKASVEAKTIIVPVETQCDSCMRTRSDYVEAILQARFHEKTTVKEMTSLVSQITKIVEERSKKDSLASIANVVKKKNGFDVYLSSNNAAKQLVKTFQQKAKEPVKKSFKIVGRDKRGKIKKRFTYCLRF